MSDRVLQQLGAASGIVYVVLIMVGGSIGGPTSTVAIVLIFLAFMFFLFFLGSLWAALRRAEKGSGWLSTTALGGGLVAIAVKLVGDAPLLALRYRAGNGLDPQLARALEDMYDAAFSLHFFPLTVLLAASAIVAIRYSALPRWLGWIAAGLAVALLGGATVGVIARVEDAGLPFLPFMLWIVMTSIVLIRQVDKPVSAVSSAPVSSPPVAS